MSAPFEAASESGNRNSERGFANDDLVEMALAVAERWPVFPCNANKKPITKHGFKDATRDPAAIRRAFRDPRAKLIGVPTGAETFDVLDFDPRHGSDAWRRENIHRLPETRVHQTPGLPKVTADPVMQGEHWLFLHADGVRNQQDGKTIAPGIDIRGEGGYVIVPPSTGYIVISDVEIAPWPDWLLPLVVKAPKPSVRPIITPPRTDQLDKRYQGYIRSLLDNVRAAADGTKHDTLLKNARAMGGILVAAGISENEAVDMLLAALPSTVTSEGLVAARRTAIDGLRHGAAEPIELKDRPGPMPRKTKGNGLHRPQPDEGPETQGNGPTPPPPPPPEDPRPDVPPPEDESQRGIAWPEPLGFFLAQDSEPPELLPEHVPAPIWVFAKDAAERMGVDPTTVALCGLVSCASVINDDWCIQPRRLDTTWTENARLWGAIVGDPSVLKTPVVSLCTRPVDRLDADARECHQNQMRDYKKQLREWKKDKEAGEEPRCPKLSRYLVEGSTVEALSEVLRDDDDGKQQAPGGKVLARHDEMGEFFGNLDRYNAGGRGGGDRGAYLRLYNGGRYTIDRIMRGSFAIPNWSACVLGGIQPAVIQKIAKFTDDDGLLQRFLYAVPGYQLPGIDRKPDGAALARYQSLFPRLAALHPPRHPDEGRSVVVLHTEAHKHREDIDAIARAMAALPDTSSRLRACFGKWAGQFARLCLTAHLIEYVDDISTGTAPPNLEVVPEATARMVACFMRDVLLPHLLRADAVMFSSMQTGHAGWIAGHILANEMKHITARDVVRAYGQLRSPEARDELAAVMASLVTVGWLEPMAPTNSAKPVSTWLVNPRVHTLFAEHARRHRDRQEKAREQVAADMETVRSRRGTPEPGDLP